MPDRTAQPRPPSPERRSFLVKAAAAILGGIAAVFPFAVGLITFADPLRRKSSSGDGFFRVAHLDAVRADGVSGPFAVIADRSDAWNRFPKEPIGAVYLRRRPGEKTPEAINAICQHAGCFVAYTSDRNVFQCPCHNSAFQTDGSIIQPSPSPRGMDKLEVKLVEERGEIWVKFQDFLPGRAKQIPKV
jgi:Rieske Fe-S protein